VEQENIYYKVSYYHLKNSIRLLVVFPNKLKEASFRNSILVFHISDNVILNNKRKISIRAIGDYYIKVKSCTSLSSILKKGTIPKLKYSISGSYLEKLIEVSHYGGSF